MIKIIDIDYIINDELRDKITYSELVTVVPQWTANQLNKADWSTFKWHTAKRKNDNEKGKTDSLLRIFEFLKYVDDCVFYKKTMKKQYENRIEIHTNIFKTFFTNKNYTKYIKILETLNIIKRCDKTNYSPKNYCYTYIVNNYHTEALFYSVVLQDKYNNDFDINLIDLDDNLIDLDDRYVNTIKHVKIDKKAAILAEINHYLANINDINNNIIKFAHRLNKIVWFGKKRYIKKGNNVDRHYHIITNLSRVARPYTNIRFYNVDLKNSQPLLLAYYLHENNINVDKNYLEDVQNGNFYENFYDLNQNNRDLTKVAIYRHIFFDFKVKEPVNIRFRELYPEVWTELYNINQQKSKTSVTLARILQNIESKIFIPIIKILKSDYMYPLHDSIYYSDENDTEVVLNYLNTTFNKMGLTASFNLE